MIKKINKNAVRKARHMRMRANISGTQTKPRLNVYRSTNHIYAQIIDDVTGKTICSASTMDKAIKAKMEGLTKKQQAKLVGAEVGKRALSKKIKQVVFDRGGYLYMGRVQELADGAREAGLQF